MRMDDDLDTGWRRIEQPVCLDRFQPLVHHGRGIDGNLAPHHPVRMSTGLFGGDACQRGRIHIAEGPTRCGEQDAPDPRLPQISCVAGRKRLEDGIVFAVNRQQQRTGSAHGSHEHVAGHDKCFLVREQDAFSGSRSGERRFESGSANDGRHYVIHSGVGSDVNQCLRAMSHLGRTTGATKFRLQQTCAFWIRRDRNPRTEADALFAQTIRLAMARDRDQFVTTTVSLQDVKRAHADRPGRTKDAYPLALRRQCHSRNRTSASATSGKVDVKLSMRSSKPPCPGRMLPLSLTPACRFARDSKRSPTMLTPVSSTSTAA